MLKLWGRPTSTNTQRVLWTLVEAGVPYELTLASATLGPKGHVGKGHAPYGIVDTAAYRAINPNGTIPTIDDGGFVLWESNAIVAYLARRYAAQDLCGGSEEAFARALQWMTWTNHAMDPAMHALIMHMERLPPEQRSARVVEESRQDMLRRMSMLEAQLAHTRYLAGDAFSIADIPPGIALTRFLHLGLDRPPMPRLEGWMALLAARDGHREHVAPRDKHFS